MKKYSNIPVVLATALALSYLDFSSSNFDIFRLAAANKFAS